MYLILFSIFFHLAKSTESNNKASILSKEQISQQNPKNKKAISEDPSPSAPIPEPNATATPSPTIGPNDNKPPSALTVWLTSVIGVVAIGATVLYLCIKKQPDDMLFDNPKSHLQTLASLNTINNFTSTDNITTPLVFSPEGSLN